MTRPAPRVPLALPPLALSLFFLFFALAPHAAAAVPIGSAPALPAGANVSGEAPAGEQLQIQVALEPTDPAALERFAYEVSNPRSPHFRDYLSVPEFAQRFGASHADVSVVRSALQERGLAVGPATANRLSLPVTATVAEAEAAFGTELNSVALAGGETAIANATAPTLPAAIAARVQGIFGLADVDRPQRRDGGEAAPLYAATAPPENAPVACAEAVKKKGESNGSFVINELAEAYDFDSVYAEKNEGEGQTAAVLEYEPFLPSDIAAFQKCFETNVPLVEENVDGGVHKYEGKPEEALEADGDIEILIGLAPEISHLIVFQSGGSEVGIFERWVEKDEAKVLSSSWGGCEKNDEASEQAAIATRLQEAATQGQSFFVAAGDEGSEDCGGKDLELEVDSPGSQPFATDVGGTKLADYKSPTREEYLWSEGPEGGGGGGGVSKLFTMPPYQLGAATSLDVVNGSSSGLPCHNSPGYCREVPDVSANASLSSEYVVYNQGAWTLTNGTSSSTPLWTALAALANASAGCHGRTIGFANPALYQVAGESYAANFHDIVQGEPGGAQSNDIRFNGTKPFQVKAGYDMATGLGSPIAGGLVKSLCGADHVYTVAVTGPGDQLTIAGAPVTVRATATDSGGAPLILSATGLPAGLAIDPASGMITGTPLSAGLSHVTVTARDSYGNQASGSFTWTVGPGPLGRRLLAARVEGLAQGKPRLTVAVAATDGETLRNVSIQLPAGVSAAPADTDVRAGASARDERNRRLGARVSTPGKQIRFDFKRGANQAHLRLGNRSLDVSEKLVREARRNHLGALPVKLTVADTAGHGRLRLSLNP
jgi:kumamolisin